VVVICKEYLDSNKLFFYKRFANNLPIFLIGKNLAKHWDFPNTGIFNFKDVASGSRLTFTTLPIEINAVPVYDIDSVA
jgi:hypothetical protein